MVSSDGRLGKRRVVMSASPVRLRVCASVRLAYYRCRRADRAATVTASPASGPSTSRAGATSWDSTRAAAAGEAGSRWRRSEEHTSELQSRSDLVCRLLLEKKNTKK